MGINERETGSVIIRGSFGCLNKVFGDGLFVEEDGRLNRTGKNKQMDEDAAKLPFYLYI